MLCNLKKKINTIKLYGALRINNQNISGKWYSSITGIWRRNTYDAKKYQIFSYPLKPDYFKGIHK